MNLLDPTLRGRIHEAENSSDTAMLFKGHQTVRKHGKCPLKTVTLFCLMKQNGKNVLIKREKYEKSRSLILHLEYCCFKKTCGAWSYGSYFATLGGSSEKGDTEAKPEP